MEVYEVFKAFRLVNQDIKSQYCIIAARAYIENMSAVSNALPHAADSTSKCSVHVSPAP